MMVDPSKVVSQQQQQQQAQDPSSLGKTTITNVNIGVLGHVDSGKTSLVKTLSTYLSTNALDKSKQSRQRGMTLDLGFSAFFLKDTSSSSDENENENNDKVKQITLVDCPGHASLIRTIIGGAQIIDMVLLVVDATKGLQAQTTECLVLAELTSQNLVVALNKVDMFPPEEREERLRAVQADIRSHLKGTRFYNCKMVGVSACVGGEKVASIAAATTTTTTATASSISSSGSNSNNNNNPAKTTDNSSDKSNLVSSSSSTTNSNNEQQQQQYQQTYNMDQLIRVLQDEIPTPRRDKTDPKQFYFSIDHCFPIRGQGTVMTGTVLSGSLAVNGIVEFPTLGRLQKKVKSMQMFRRKITNIQQGDRAGICVANFDANLLERGVAAAPNSVHLIKGAIALVRKVRYYKETLFSRGKKSSTTATNFHISVGHVTVMASVTFWGAKELAEQQQKQQQQEEVASKSDKDISNHSQQADLAGLPRIPFSFHDDFIQNQTNNNNNNTAIITEEGRPENDEEDQLHWALLDFATPVYCPLDSLVIGSRLDVDSNLHASACRLAFCGRLVEKLDPKVDYTRIRLYSPKERRGVVCRLGDPHRREDDGKVVRYEVFGDDLFKKESNMKLFVGMKLVTERDGDVGVIKSSFGTSGKFRVWFPAGTQAQEGEALLLKFKRYVHDTEKAMHQDDIVVPAARSGTRIVTETQKKKKEKPIAVGSVTLLKGDTLEGSNGSKFPTAIVSGFFSPDVNIREKVGFRVFIRATKEEGKIAGPFGKAGKCKVNFENGVSAKEGTKAELFAPS